MMKYRPRRSVLYMPGANARALEKAQSLSADGLILDLEDSVAPEMKAEARDRVCSAVRGGGFGDREIIIRINSPVTPWGPEDLAAAVAAHPHAILLPKLSSVVELRQARAQAGHVPLWAMVETPLALLNLADIGAAAASAGLVSLVLGCNDLVKETRIRPQASRAELVPLLSHCVVVARAFGLACIDGVFNDIKDDTGFMAECEQGVRLGMDGKTLIHPSQIEPCNRIFSPEASEVVWAERIIAAFAQPENAAKGVITLDGKMVERLHLTMAERVVALVREVAP